MMDSRTADLALATFAPVSITAWPERCLNHYEGRVGCRLCHGCPSAAIVPADSAEGWKLESGRCIGCGLCAAICPTEVFAPHTTHDVVASILASPSAGPREVVCPRRVPIDRSRAGARVVIPVVCLAGLSLADLVAAEGEVWLDDTPCLACPIGGVHRHMVRTLDTANSLRAISGRPPVHRYQQEAGHLPLRAALATVHDPSSPLPMSRRQFLRTLTFGLLGGAGHQGSGRSVDFPPDGTTKQGLPRRVPTARRRLLQVLARSAPADAGEISGDAVPLATIRVTDACTACGGCAEVCPTGAIGFRSDGDYYVLEAEDDLCLGWDCRACVHTCPVDAVQLRPGLDVQAIGRCSPRVMRAGRLIICARCGRPMVAPSDGVPVCPLCRSQEPAMSGAPE